MRHDLFTALCQQYEANIFQNMMTTKPQELKTRESLFASYQGVKDFLALMKSAVEIKNQLTAPAPSEQDAHDAEDII